MATKKESRPSLQEVLRQRQQDIFVGRDEVLMSFSENLALPLTDPRRRFVTNIYGQGGLGKTTVLRQLERTGWDAKAVVGWTDHNQSDLLAAMSALARTLEGDFGSFFNLVEAYERHRHTLESDPSAPVMLGGILGAAIGRGGVILGRRIPIVGAALEFVDEDATSEQFAGMGAFIARKLKRDDADLVQDPIKYVTPAFIQGLASHSDSATAVLLLFDTYERTSHFLEYWLLDLLGGVYGGVPGSLVLVIAGRSALEPNAWAPYEDIIQRIELRPLDNADAAELLRRKGVRDSNLVNEILRLSAGIPLLITTLASNVSASGAAAKGPDTAVERFLSWETDPDRRRILLDAALPRTLNRDVFGVVAPDLGEATFDWLRTMPFVQPAAAGWEYHSVVRRPMLQHSQRDSPLHWNELNKKLANHHRQSTVAIVDNRQRGMRDIRWRRADSNETYHLLLADYDRFATLALGRAVRALSSDASFAAETIESIVDAEEDLAINLSLRWGVRLRTAMSRLEIESYTELAELYTDMIDASQLSFRDETRSQILFQRYHAHVRRLDYQAALDDIEAAIDLAPTRPHLRYYLATILHRMRRLDEAVLAARSAIASMEAEGTRYQDTIKATRIEEVRIVWDRDGPEAALPLVTDILESGPHPWALLTRGQLYRALERPEEAVADLTAAIDQSPSLNHEASKEIGLAYFGLGDYERAEEWISRSLNVLPICSHCWTLLARVYRKRLEDDGAVLDAVMSTLADNDDPRISGMRAVALEAVGLTEAALTLYDQAVDSVPYDGWYRGARGDLLARLGRKDEALADAEAAIGESRYLPALRLRARLLAEMGEVDGARRDVARYKAIYGRSADVNVENMIGLQLARQGRLSEAIEAYEEGLKEHVDYVPLLYNLAVAKALVGAEDAGEAARLAVAAATEGTDVALYARAGLAAVSGDIETAVSLVSQVGLEGAFLIAALPDDPAWSGSLDDPRVRGALAGRNGER